MSSKTIPDYVGEHFAKHPGPVRPAIRTKRGAPLSVQASSIHYCTPRDDTGPYTRVEVFWTGSIPQALRDREGRQSEPYGWAPVSVVNEIIHKRGGVA